MPAFRIAPWLLLIPLLGHAQPVEPLGMAEVDALGQINGTALACQDLPRARRTKDLMVRHAPKTERYGTRFDEATQQGYRAVLDGRTPCPDNATVDARLQTLAQRLQTVLPASSGTQP